MSILSSILNFFKKIFRKVLDMLQSVLNALGPLFPLLVIAAMLWGGPIGFWLVETMGAPAWIGTAVASIMTVSTTFGAYGAVAIGLGVSAILAPETVSGLVTVVADVAGQVIDASIGVIGDGLGAISASLGINWWLLGALAAGVYFVTNKRDDGSYTSQKEGALRATNNVTV